MTRKILASILLTLAALVVIGGGWGYATIRDMSGAEYWEKSIKAFETKDAESPPPKDAVLLSGVQASFFGVL